MRLYIYLLLLLYLIVIVRSNNLVRIGINIPLTGETATFGNYWKVIAEIAEDTINQKGLIPNHTLKLEISDTNTQRAGVVKTAITCSLDVGLDNDTTVDACLGAFGGETSEYSQLMQYVFQNYDVPQISAMSTATVLSDKSQYPTFFRTIPSDSAAGNAFAQVIRHFGWNRVCVLVGSDSFSISLYRSFKEATMKHNITIEVETFMEANDPVYHAHITDLKESYIQIFVIFAEADDVEILLVEGYKQGILGPNFVWMGADTFHSLESHKLPPAWAMMGTISIAASSTTNTSLAEEYLELTGRANVSNYYGGFVYDAIYAFAYASKYMVENNRNLTRKEMMAALMKVNFEGVSGDVYFDEQGDRTETYYGVSSYNAEGDLAPVGLLADGKYIQYTPIVWADGTTNTPPNVLLIIEHPPTRPVKKAFDIVAGIMLAILCLLLIAFVVVLLTKHPVIKVKMGQVLVHVINTVGGVFGYTAILLIVAGVSDGHCTAAVVLMDLSLLICGGALSLRTVMKFVEEYKDHVKQGIMHPRTASYILFSIWTVLTVLNMAVLIGTLSHTPPGTSLHLLDKNIYEYQCSFSLAAIIILPLTIGLLFIFSLFTTLLKIFINRAVATKKNDILNSANNIITLFALVVATVTLILIEPTQTQIDVTICVVILLANMSAPTALLGWFYSPKRKDAIFRGLVEKDNPLSPRQQVHRHSVVHETSPSLSISPSLSSSPSSLSFSHSPPSLSHLNPPVSPRTQRPAHQSLSAAELNAF